MRRERIVLGAILLVALALRIAWCFHAARLPGGGLHDPNFYLLYGQQLANGNGYRLLDGHPTAYYPPGYAFALAPLMWLGYHWPLNRLTSPEVGLVAALNIASQLVTIVLTYLVTRTLTRSLVAASVAAAALALWPNLIFHTAVALTESVFLCLLMIAALLLVTAPWARDARWETWRLVAVGFVLGLATLVRPVTVPVLPMIGIALLVAHVGWRRALHHTAIITGVVLAVLVPWMVRNALVMHQLTLSTNTGDNLCMSRHLGGTGGFEFPNDECFVGNFDRLERPEFELARDRHGRQVAIDFVKDHPGEEARLWFRRAGALFMDDADGLAAVESYDDDPWMSARERNDLHRVANAYYVLVGASGLVGLAVLLRRPTPARVVLVLTGVGMLVPPIIFFGDPRFHVPAVPIVAVGVGVLGGALAASYRSTARST